jgi:hypothetical protein
MYHFLQQRCENLLHVFFLSTMLDVMASILISWNIICLILAYDDAQLMYLSLKKKQLKLVLFQLFGNWCSKRVWLCRTYWSHFWHFSHLFTDGDILTKLHKSFNYLFRQIKLVLNTVVSLNFAGIKFHAKDLNDIFARA